MNRSFSALALSAALLLLPAAGQAQQPPRCASSPDGDTVSITCGAVSEEVGNQIAEMLSRMLNSRIPPNMVLAAFNEIEPLPPEGVARTLTPEQQQSILNQLAGKPTQQVSIVAHPLVPDSADYARSLAQPLLMVGWQVEGNQVRRAAPKSLEQVYGVALVVQNADAPPDKAVTLRKALQAGRIPTPLLVDPTLAPEATQLYIGKRQSLGAAK
ncbi:MAG TPA: hypothetical protein VHU15_12905 [Stellaceae bacterium]|jgi:hypothetical protein|nr:hypothetical protein [Stellaceae bacterium]